MPNPDPNLTAHPNRQLVARRGLTGWLALLLMLHALLIPGQRTAERAHFHIAQSGVAIDGGLHDQAGSASPPVPRVLDPMLVLQLVRPVPPPIEHLRLQVRGDDARNLFRHKRDVADHDAVHDAVHAHDEHAVSAVHEHAQDRADVVYVDAHESEPAAGTTSTPKRVALDIDAALQRLPVTLAATRSPAPDAGLAVDFRSRSELPLERPPRARA